MSCISSFEVAWYGFEDMLELWEELQEGQGADEACEGCGGVLRWVGEVAFIGGGHYSLLKIIDAEVMIGGEGFTRRSGATEVETEFVLSGEEVHD